MTQKEFEQLTNNEKLNYINNYVGDTARFSKENEFSWSTATRLTKAKRKDGKYVFDDDNTKEENKYEILYKLQKGEKVKTTININKEIDEMLEQKKEEDNLTKTELINYCLYKYLKGCEDNE